MNLFEQILAFHDNSKRDFLIGSTEAGRHWWRIDFGSQAADIHKLGEISKPGAWTALGIGVFSLNKRPSIILRNFKDSDFLLLDLQPGGSEELHSLRFSKIDKDYSECVVGDFNQDGLADLFCRNPLSGSLWMGLSHGDGHFSEMNGPTLDPGQASHGVFSLHILGDNSIYLDTDQASVYRVNLRKNAANEPILAIERIVDYKTHRTLYHYSTELVGSGDFDGDGSLDLLARSLSGGIWAASFLGSGVEKSVYEWARTPPSASVSFSGIGDFNGDGRADILARLADSKDWWLALSGGLSGVERSVPRIFSRNETWSSFTLGDFDGNGLSDLLAWNARSHSWWGAFASKGESQTEESSLSSPKICIGFNPGVPYKWGQLWESCPAGFAVMATDDIVDAVSSAKEVVAVVTCCPLPTQDILLTEDVLSADTCPSDYIATGVQAEHSGDYRPRKLLCTKINTARYQLGPEQKADYWGFGESRKSGQSVISKNLLPVAFRHAVGRTLYMHWDVDGCVGSPPGSILTAKKIARGCERFLFRELQYVGNPGDPPEGSPVKVFPDCRAISDVFDPLAKCIP